MRHESMAITKISTAKVKLIVLCRDLTCTIDIITVGQGECDLALVITLLSTITCHAMTPMFISAAVKGSMYGHHP